MTEKKEYGVRYFHVYGSAGRWISVFDRERMKASRFTLEEARAEARELIKCYDKVRIYKGNTMVEEVTA